MKKIRSNSKRKWIVGGVLGFASVALITTGFATWVVGTSILNQDNTIGVDVQTAINQSVTMNATITDKEGFHLGEPTNAGNTGDLVTVEEGAATDFDIVFKKIEIKCGEDYFTKHFDNNTSFDLTLAANDGEVKNSMYAKNTVSESKIDAKEKADETKIRKGASSWTYIDLDTRTNTIVTGSGNNWSGAVNGIRTLTLSEVKFTFGWGTFFNKVAPSKFYNDNKANIVNDLDKVAAVTEELTAMKKAFSAASGVLPFVLTLVPGTVA